MKTIFTTEDTEGTAKNLNKEISGSSRAMANSSSRGTGQEILWAEKTGCQRIFSKKVFSVPSVSSVVNACSGPAIDYATRQQERQSCS